MHPTQLSAARKPNLHRASPVNAQLLRPTPYHQAPRHKLSPMLLLLSPQHLWQMQLRTQVTQLLLCLLIIWAVTQFWEQSVGSLLEHCQRSQWLCKAVPRQRQQCPAEKVQPCNNAQLCQLPCHKIHLQTLVPYPCFPRTSQVRRHQGLRCLAVSKVSLWQNMITSRFCLKHKRQQWMVVPSPVVLMSIVNRRTLVCMVKQARKPFLMHSSISQSSMLQLLCNTHICRPASFVQHKSSGHE